MMKESNTYDIKQRDVNSYRACFNCAYAEIADDSAIILFCKMHSRPVYNTAVCTLWIRESDIPKN